MLVTQVLLGSLLSLRNMEMRPLASEAWLRQQYVLTVLLILTTLYQHKVSLCLKVPVLCYNQCLFGFCNMSLFYRINMLP